MDGRRSSFKGVALITGGASGIGRALGEELGRRGLTVVLADRQLALAEQVAAGICEAGGRASAHELDVRDPDAFAALAREVHEREGTIDYLFNNAGIAIQGAVADYARGDWAEVLDVNLRGVANGVDAVYPIMVAQRSGHIVNTASMAGLLPTPGGTSYATSKHAVVGLTKSLRIEAAGYGVRVSMLCPGPIETPILFGGTFGGFRGRRPSQAQLEQLWRQVRPMNVDVFAREVLRRVARDEPYIILPRVWKTLWLLERLTPRLSLRLWAYIRGVQLRELGSESRR